jgi:NitT/TauT family transport system substrate-binding protein
MSRHWRRGTIILSAIIALGATLALAFCSGQTSAPLRISISSWIGYTPLYYVHEKGWMANRLRFLPVSSLAESERMYQAGMTDGFAATQYEYQHCLALSDAIVPVILLSRSNGADGILSSVPIEEIISSADRITVYLETQTVNRELFRSFREKNRLPASKFTLTNLAQESIAVKKPGPDPILLVTYEPYKTILREAGFFEIANTRDISLLVLDAVFVERKTLDERKPVFEDLYRNIRRALDALRTDPYEFYVTVKPYLGGMSYDRFSDSLADLEWLPDNLTRQIEDSMAANKIPMEWLIK